MTGSSPSTASRATLRIALCLGLAAMATAMPVTFAGDAAGFRLDTAAAFAKSGRGKDGTRDNDEDRAEDRDDRDDDDRDDRDDDDHDDGDHDDEDRDDEDRDQDRNDDRDHEDGDQSGTDRGHDDRTDDRGSSGPG
ncbi:MAG: hypothetical protein KDK28_15910, partial [Maritimibacter sp.]|nr:hypothetical protein [Maritimibacter sp.]